MNCDFCFSEDVTHVLPAYSFETSMEGVGSKGDWACCAVCAGLLHKNDWKSLMVRVKASWEHKHGLLMKPQAITMMNTTYRLLRKNIRGPVRPI